MAANVEEKADLPLISQKANGYNSTDSHTSTTSGDGGLIQSIPSQGYCLVFTKEPEYGLGSNKTSPYLIEFKNETLVIDRHTDLSGGLAEYREDGWERKLQEALCVPSHSEGPYDLLANFKAANILFSIERDRIDKFFYVIITTSLEHAERWADKHRIDVPINATEAIKCGRQFPEFMLAHRTYIDGDKKDKFSVNDPENKERAYDKLEQSFWDNIHVPYDTNVDPKIYFRGKHDSIINDRIYLRILYEMVTDDVPLGGANFIVSKYLSSTYHPLTHFFALHDSKDERPGYSIDKDKNKSWFKCRTPNDNLIFCDRIRDYYGENVGFYFHFLAHYTKWLYPMAVLGTIWFVVQMGASKRFGIATPGSTIIVLVAIMWSTLMIENWYRREWKLRFKWGMMRYQETEIPRPTFSGKIQVSRENGELIETYSSWYRYCCKVTFSMSTMLLCVAMVVGIVIALFILRGNQTDQVMTIGIGMVNSIQIFIMNKIYTWLAYRLNEWEGHRLQQDYYNNLVIKRIIFIVFNSFYSLFYIAFFDNNNALYTDDEVRLEAVRTQLITLFLMAIFLQNTMEIFFPWLAHKIARFCAKKEEAEYVESNYPNQPQSAGLLSQDKIADDAKGVFVGVADDDNNNSLQTIGVSKNGISFGKSHTPITPEETMRDISQQIKLTVSPDVLDNTAEIVVLHGYIMLFVIIFPLMPLLASINNYLELRVDVYNLLNAKRPIPLSAAGLGVWKSVLSCFNIIAVFSNLAILTFRTPLIQDLLKGIGSNEQYNTDVNLIIFYFCMVLLLLFIIFTLRLVVDDTTMSTKEAIARQESCERHLLMAPVQALARQVSSANSKRDVLLKVKET